MVEEIYERRMHMPRMMMERGLGMHMDEMMED
jgi:hypothetical protein